MVLEPPLEIQTWFLKKSNIFESRFSNGSKKFQNVFDVFLP